MTGPQSRVFRVTGFCKKGWEISHLVTAVDVVRAIQKMHKLDKQLAKVTRVEYAHPLYG